MTIFDSIRYPISGPPTKKELEDLPVHIFKKWIINSEWNFMTNTVGPGTVARWYAENWKDILENPTDYKKDINDIKLLKKMISEEE